MSNSPLDTLLSTLCNRGYITLVDSDPPSLKYDEQTWLEVARYFQERTQKLADKYWLLYEGILCGDDGEQFSESETTEFLLKCAYGKEHLHHKLLKFCERHVREYHEYILLDKFKAEP